jgi:hypothetical protein
MPDNNQPPQSSIILYRTEDGRTRIECRFENDTLWLTQKLMAELFQKDVRTINEHILNIFAEGELAADSAIRKFRITASDGKTTPELIAERADSARPNMGLTAWKSGAVRKGDVTVAKNYLREDEIDELNRIVVMFLDFAEDQARRRKQIFLHNWETRLDDFLLLNERAILPDAGKVSRRQADTLAEQEYDRFAARRRTQLEDDAQADTLKQLEDELKKLPATKKPKRPKP